MSIYTWPRFQYTLTAGSDTHTTGIAPGVNYSRGNNERPILGTVFAVMRKACSLRSPFGVLWQGSDQKFCKAETCVLSLSVATTMMVVLLTLAPPRGETIGIDTILVGVSDDDNATIQARRCRRQLLPPIRFLPMLT